MIELYLKVGRENAVTRQFLRSVTGMSDRDVRQDIEIMRQKGIPIMSSSRTAGYWLAESIDEVESLQKELLHRADELYKTAEALRSVAI